MDERYVGNSKDCFEKTYFTNTVEALISGNHCCKNFVPLIRAVSNNLELDLY